MLDSPWTYSPKGKQLPQRLRQFDAKDYDLGAVYSVRLLGERADNLNQAIDFYQRALEVHTRETYPREWAMTRNALGAVFIIPRFL